MLHRYAGENGVIPRSARLVELNCADYANNPELLSSTLFGYVKGAFTGADKEKTGLLDEADGGFFFLDEVHLLSAENQEKLFLFMDKGYFYRLGDNRQPCHARVRFLFATTENSENVLLTTFRRRIPVMVELPSSESRPFSEKLALVSTFFQAEAQRFKQDIHVTTDLIRHLITSPGRGNIGELKSRIKVLCASAYTQGQKNSIRLVGNPPAQDDSENVIFHWDENTFPALPLTPTRSVAGETLLDNFCRSANVPLFVRKLEEHYHATLGEAAAGRLYQGVLWKTTVDTLREFTELSGLRLGEMMEKAVFHCLQWCLHDTVSSAAIEHLTVVTEYIPQRACLLASETVSLLQRRLPETPAPLLHPLLSAVFCHQVEQVPLIQGIIVAHGLTTASSIAGTANNLLGSFYLKAFDMPLSVDTRGIISHLTTWIDGLKEQAGMVILVDMGSLEDMYAEIKLHIQGDLLVMNNVSTTMALDIAEKIQQRLSMKEIVDGIKGAWEIEARYYSGIVQGNKLIISCISGEGVSKQLQEIARRYVNDETLDVVTMEYDDLKWKLAKADSALYGTRLIITTTELNANAIPIINVRKLIGDKPDQLWKNYFSTIMSADRLKQMVDEIVILFTIEEVASHLSFLNPNVIIEEVEDVVKFYEMTYNIHFESYLRINLFLHLAAMIERLMTHDGLNHREDSELTDQQGFVE